METNPAPSRQFPVVLQALLLPLWALLCMFMLVSTLIGLACILGVVLFCVDLSGVLEIQLLGESVQTTRQKVLFTALGAGMAVAGIGCWWLWRRDSVGRALIVCAVMLGLLGMIAWLTGSVQILSVGGR